jgi:hypothetical protein
MVPPLQRNNEDPVEHRTYAMPYILYFFNDNGEGEVMQEVVMKRF